MTRAIVAALAAVALAAAPASAARGTPGPFPGAVRHGETRTHAFDNDPLDQGCPQVMTTYTVTLSYAPPTDVLALYVGTFGVTGHDGRASLSLTASWCTSFDLRVTGTAVGATAGYIVNVVRGGATVSG